MAIRDAFLKASAKVVDIKPLLVALEAVRNRLYDPPENGPWLFTGREWVTDYRTYQGRGKGGRNGGDGAASPF
jgi:hypothetical protein